MTDPGMTEPPQDGEQQTLDSASSALEAADPESLYRSGRCFAATADRLRSLSDEFRTHLADLENAWQGPGSEAFADTAAQIAHRVEDLATTLSSPSYDWLCREMGDALTGGQRELRQLRSARSEQNPAAQQDNPAQQGEQAQQGNRASPQDGRAQQVMTELANTYRQLGGQLRPLAEDGPPAPGTPQAPHTGTGAAHLDGTSGHAEGPQIDAAGDPLHVGSAGAAALPAGGVLGKTSRATPSPDPSAAEHAEAPRGTLGRSETTPEPGIAATPGILPTTGAALGRSDHGRRENRAPTEKLQLPEADHPAVLGGDKRPSPQPGVDDGSQVQQEQREDGIATESADTHQQAEDRAAATVSAPPPPATTSAPPPAAVQDAPPAALPQTPAHAAAHAEPAAAQTVHPPSGQPQVPQPQFPQPHAGSAASPFPRAAGSLETGVVPADAGPPTPPGPEHTPHLPEPHHDPATEARNSGGGPGMPPPHGAGAGGPGAGGAAGAAGDADGERERNTWLTERPDAWQHHNQSGVLGR